MLLLQLYCSLTDMEMDGACWRMAISDANSTEVRADIEAAIAEWAGGHSHD